MRKIYFVVIALGLFFSTVVVNAQWTKNAVAYPTKSGLEIYFTGQNDSTGQTYGTLTSNVFTMADYDGVADIEYTYHFTNALGAPKAKVTLLHSDETQVAGSMIATVLIDSCKTEVEAHTYKALQGIRAKYYRLKVESLDGYQAGRDNTVFFLLFTLPKRDF